MENPLHPVLTIRLFSDEKAFGPGIAQLLEHIDTLHSLRKAAAEMGMAYSKAWTIMKNSAKALGFPLVITAVGGKEGGGTELTPEARKLLADYREYCRKIRAYSEEIFADCFA